MLLIVLLEEFEEKDSQDWYRRYKIYKLGKTIPRSEAIYPPSLHHYALSAGRDEVVNFNAYPENTSTDSGRSSSTLRPALICAMKVGVSPF